MNINKITIVEKQVSDKALTDLIRAHKHYCKQHTPTSSGHALSVNSNKIDKVVYWLASVGNEPAGCIGLAPFDGVKHEIKTFHVLENFRGLGIGIALLDTLLKHAKQHGIKQVCLETGSSEGFAASRYLYKKLGFAQCEKFGDYIHDPFSYCMSLMLK